jgi:hypothetical protein
MGRDAGSHSVDRIVRVFSFLLALTPAGKVFEEYSDSGGLGKWHLIEVYFCGVGVSAKGGIKPKPRFDGKEYISAELTPLQWIRGKSCPLRLGRVALEMTLMKAVGTGLGFLEKPSEKILFFANVRDHRHLPAGAAGAQEDKQ